MRIKDIKPGMNDLQVKAKVVRIEETRRSLSKEHALAWLVDGSGEIRLNLWQDQISQVSVGDVVHLKSASARKYKGLVLELSTWEERIEVARPEKAKS